MLADRKAKLSVDGVDNAIELPVYPGTAGPDVIDVRGLTAEGLFTYDPGFVATASCESGITYIDGAAGTLLQKHDFPPYHGSRADRQLLQGLPA